MFFYIGLGEAVNSGSVLKTAACETGGIFASVVCISPLARNLHYSLRRAGMNWVSPPWVQNDGDPVALRNAMAAYIKYAALGNADGQSQTIRFSEPYVSIPDVWGKMVTVVNPVFDKQAIPWALVGVAGVDVSLCELVLAGKESGVFVHRCESSTWLQSTGDDVGRGR